MTAPFAQELSIAKRAATAAAAEILRLGPAARTEKSDGSPVTAADMAANETICNLLSREFPADGLLSEEAGDDGARLMRQRVWVVDPLDGTRDFVAGTGQYAVHVALVVGGQAQVGVVCEPAAGRLSWAVRGQGAFTSEAENRPVALRVSHTISPPWRLGTSRFAANDALHAFVRATPGVQAFPMGASTKMMALARGDLDACVWLSAAEKEWDTCAPSLIVTEAGGRVTSLRGHPFTYNRADVVHRDGIVASNGVLHEMLLERASTMLPAEGP